jgi:hypothetical protein
MTVTIDPVEFTRLMTLPATDRHTLLEFLGSTISAHVGTAELFRQARNARPRVVAARTDNLPPVVTPRC